MKTKLESREVFTFTDGKRIMPSAQPKEPIKQLLIIHPVFLLRSQALKYKHLVWPGNKSIRIIRAKIIQA